MGDLLHWIVDEASRGLSEGESIDALTAIKWKVIDHLHAPAQSPLPPMPDEVSLANPNFVHINMLRGGIAKPTWSQIQHLYPEEFAALRAPEADKLETNYPKRLSTMRTMPPELTGQGSETSETGVSIFADRVAVAWRWKDSNGRWHVESAPPDASDDIDAQPLYAPADAGIAAPPASADAVREALLSFKMPNGDTLGEEISAQVDDRIQSVEDRARHMIEVNRVADAIAALSAPVAGADEIRDELRAALATFNSNPSEQNKAALLNGLWTCREALVGGADLTSTDLCTLDVPFMAHDILAFLNSIEGAGYGGMASFEIARGYAEALSHTPHKLCTPEVKP